MEIAVQAVVGALLTSQFAIHGYLHLAPALAITRRRSLLPAPWGGRGGDLGLLPRRRVPARLYDGAGPTVEVRAAARRVGHTR